MNEVVDLNMKSVSDLENFISSLLENTGSICYMKIVCCVSLTFVFYLRMNSIPTPLSRNL